MTPPSEASKNWFGFRGLVTRRCSSGCIPFGWSTSVASIVMSVKLSPAFVERSTARWLATYGPFVPSSLYWYEPPRKTVSGCPGGV
jgi:hypothetical protein